MRWATSAAPTRMPPSVSVSVAASPLLPSNTTITCHHPGGHPRVSLQLQPHTQPRAGRVPPALFGCPPACRRGPRGLWSPCAASSGCCRLPTVTRTGVAGDACAVRLAVLRAGCVVGVLRRCVQCVVQPCGWPCGWRDGCVCGWPDGWVCGSGWARTDIDDLVVGVPHLAQRLGCAQRLDDWPGCMRPGSRSRWGEGRNRDDRAQHGGGRRFEFSLICTRRRGECY